MFIPNNYRVSLINPIKKIPTIVNRRGFCGEGGIRTRETL